MTLAFIPAIREWTRPSLMSWREEAKAVAVPKWEELQTPQRQFFANLAGSEATAPILFGWLFRWFFVPHELTHALQTSLGSSANHASSERVANDLAVAFYQEQPGGSDPLESLTRILEDVLPRLPGLPPDSDEYFNQHYDELSQTPLLYASFQLRFVLDSLQRRAELRFDHVAAKLREGAP